MGCNNKIKQTCGTKNFATCIDYQGTVSENTTLNETECLGVQEVIEDLYTMVDIVKEEIDFSSLENNCITFTSPKTPLSVITQMYNKICELEAIVVAQGEVVATHTEQIEALQENVCN